jgi:membrane associated rhomboid family serine protease
LAEAQQGPLEQWEAFVTKYGAGINPDGTLRPAVGSQVVLYAIVAVNVVVFLMWQVAAAATAAGFDFPQWMMDTNFAVSFQAVFYHFRVWTLFTSAFSHQSFTHILFNMIALVLFGRDTAGVLGPVRFIKIYFVGAFFASFGHMFLQILTGSNAPALGASGSIMAISAVYGCLFPTRRIMVMIPVPIPAGIAVVLYILIDLCGAIRGGDGVAHGAHLGGAFYGVAYGITIGRWRLRQVIARSRPPAAPQPRRVEARR